MEVQLERSKKEYFRHAEDWDYKPAIVEIDALKQEETSKEKYSSEEELNKNYSKVKQDSSNFIRLVQ